MNPRLLILILAVVSTLLSAASLSLFGSLRSPGYWILNLVILGLAYGIIYFILHKFIFKELERIAKSIPGGDNKARKKTDNPVLELENKLGSYKRSKDLEVEELTKRAVYRREFIADVSHELKTPLFAAQGFVLTLLDGAVKDKSVREKFLKKAARNLEGLERLIQDLLSLSQIETGSIKVHREYFDLSEIIEEVFDQFESSSQEKNIQLNLSLGDVTPKQGSTIVVYGDPGLIHQVISNLVSNAIQYSRTGGLVDVMLVENETEVEVAVKDQGIGIPSKHQPRIFERFYRVDKSRSKIKKLGGTGLGLAIVKHILEAHHSTIEVQSQVGEGSVFSFRLRKDP